jgi:hypothetical protein
MSCRGKFARLKQPDKALLVVHAAFGGLQGDGKTTVARHLAGAAARMGSRVLLLEADLRRSTIAQHLDIQSGPGVSDVLIGAVSFSEATQMVGLDLQRVDGSGGRSLDVLVAGSSLPPNPGELIEPIGGRRERPQVGPAWLLWLRLLLRLRGRGQRGASRRGRGVQRRVGVRRARADEPGLSRAGGASTPLLDRSRHDL